MTGWLSRYSGDQANTEALRINKPEDKGLFEGGLKATGEGIAYGGVAVGRAAQLAGSTIPLFQDALWGLDPNAENSAYREYMDVTDPWLKPAEDAYQIDENAGAGAQVLGGLGRIVLPLMAGGGNPTPLIASETTIGAQDALKQGATSEQAVGIGVAQGAVAGLGFKIPAAIGNNAATKIASGAAINVGLGAGLRGVQGTIAGDNEKLAEMYDPLDPTYVMTDLAIGATFGAIAAIAGKRRAAPLDQQDVITDAEIQQQTQASAPVTPDSPNTANRHAQNLDAAEQALNTGQPVSAKPIIRPREPSTEIESMSVDERKALKYNSPQLDAYAAHTEQKYGLPDGILNAVKNSGEHSNSDQVSPAGAQGVMQFIPSTWDAYGKGLDPTDPMHSIDAAGRFWADLIKQYDGNVLAAAAHYNGGAKQGKLVASGKRPSNAETAGYVDRIEQHLGAMGKDVPMPRIDEPVVTDGEPPIVQPTPDVQPAPDLFSDALPPQADAQPIAQPDVAPLVRSVIDGDIVLSTGLPFETMRDAKKAIESKKLGSDYSVQEVDGGYVVRKVEQPQTQPSQQSKVELTADNPTVTIQPESVAPSQPQQVILNTDGKPYSSARQADISIAIKGLDDTHRVQEMGGGYVIVPKTPESTTVQSAPKASNQPASLTDVAMPQQPKATAQPDAQPTTEQATAPKADTPNSVATPEQQAALDLPDDLRIPTGELDADGNPITMTAKEMRDQLAAEKAVIDEQTKANDAAITCALGFGE